MKTRTELPLVVLLSLLLGAPMLTSGCTEAEKERMAAAAENRRRGEAQRVLKERALEYWEAVRWKNWSMAAIYLEEANDQKRFLQIKTAPDAVHPDMDDVDIAYTFVDPETFESGEVRVTWNHVSATAAQVAEQQETQRWYKANGRWWIDPESSLLDTTPATATASDDRTP